MSCCLCVCPFFLLSIIVVLITNHLWNLVFLIRSFCYFGVSSLIAYFFCFQCLLNHVIFYPCFCSAQYTAFNHRLTHSLFSVIWTPKQLVKLPCQYSSPFYLYRPIHLILMSLLDVCINLCLWYVQATSWYSFPNNFRVKQATKRMCTARLLPIFSIICFKQKILSVQELPVLKPGCTSISTIL